MAKMMNKFKAKRYSNRIDALTALITFDQDYLPILVQKSKEKAERRIAKKKMHLEEELAPYAIEAGVENSYLKESEQGEIKNVEDRYYWKKRALNQSKKRKLNRVTAEKKAAVEKEFQLRLQIMNDHLNSDLSKVSNKYHKVATSDSQKNYQLKNIKCQKEIADYVTLSTQKSESYIANKQARYNNRIVRNQAKRAFYKEKLGALLKSDSVFEKVLDQDVLLEIEHLSMYFGGLKAVDDLSLQVKKGEIFGLIGPNGAGKTTVFNCITRFYKPTYGTVYYRNKNGEVINLDDYKVHNVIKEGIVRTFQNVELIWELSVLDNLLVAGHTLYKSGFFGHMFASKKLKQEEDVLRKKALDILQKLNLAPYQHMIPLGLPYGTLKMIELARTLMINPNLIILDEPAAGLNDVEKIAFAQTIKDIQKEYQTTIFLVEHDMGLVMGICDTICAISFGKKLAIGTPSQIQNDKAVQEAYLGGE